MKKKKNKNKTKETEKFKQKDLACFKCNKLKWLKILGKNTTDTLIMTVDEFSPKIGNQKNGWTNVSIFQVKKLDPYMCPGRALGSR